MQASHHRNTHTTAAIKLPASPAVNQRAVLPTGTSLARLCPTVHQNPTAALFFALFSAGKKAKKNGSISAND